MDIDHQREQDIPFKTTITDADRRLTTQTMEQHYSEFKSVIDGFMGK